MSQAFRLQPITAENFKPEDVNANFEQLSERLGELTSSSGLQRIAALLAGAYFAADLIAGVELRVRHYLRRVPTGIVFPMVLSGAANGGHLFGVASGPGGAANANRWDQDYVFVKASVTGRYAFVVI